MAKGEEPRALTIHILGREYQINCPPKEQDALIASAEYLNERMSAIRRSGRSIGNEKIAIMAALNIARELLEREQQSGRTRPLQVAGGSDVRQAEKHANQEADTRARIQQMELAIERALEAGK